MHFNLHELIKPVGRSSFWPGYLEAASAPASRIGVHLAIFAEPFLSLVFNGKKTIESRFSRIRCAPYGEVDAGDVVLIKEVSGPVCGLAIAKRTWFFELAYEPISRIRSRFGDTIGADDSFWVAQQDAAYATLIELAEISRTELVVWNKRDRRGWVALRRRQLAFRF